MPRRTYLETSHANWDLCPVFSHLSTPFSGFGRLIWLTARLLSRFHAASDYVGTRDPIIRLPETRCLSSTRTPVRRSGPETLLSHATILSAQRSGNALHD